LNLYKKNENFYKKFLKKHKKNIFYDFLGKVGFLVIFTKKTCFYRKKTKKGSKRAKKGVKKGAGDPQKGGFGCPLGRVFSGLTHFHKKNLKKTEKNRFLLRSLRGAKSTFFDVFSLFFGGPKKSV